MIYKAKRCLTTLCLQCLHFRAFTMGIYLTGCVTHVVWTAVVHRVLTPVWPCWCYSATHYVTCPYSHTHYVTCLTCLYSHTHYVTCPYSHTHYVTCLIWLYTLCNILTVPRRRWEMGAVGQDVAPGHSIIEYIQDPPWSVEVLKCQSLVLTYNDGHPSYRRPVPVPPPPRWKENTSWLTNQVISHDNILEINTWKCAIQRVWCGHNYTCTL